LEHRRDASKSVATGNPKLQVKLAAGGAYLLSEK